MRKIRQDEEEYIRVKIQIFPDVLEVVSLPGYVPEVTETLPGASAQSPDSGDVSCVPSENP